MNGIYKLGQEVSRMGQLSPEYWDKMMHEIPKTGTVNRSQYILEKAQNRFVLDIGASGPMATELAKVASTYHGIDLTPNPALPNMHILDLDSIEALPKIPGVELVVAGEVIEHLSNPGHFLDLLQAVECPILLTTPNAFTKNGRQWLAKGYENVSRDHVAWYSYTTLKTLVDRHGYRLLEWYWYNGKPLVAEGLVFLMESDNGLS